MMKCVWLAVGLWCSSCVCAEVFTATVTFVSDGDTVWVTRADRSVQKLRLLGLDAPEICQAGGAASRDALKQRVGNHKVQVTVKYQDRYGRGLALVRQGQQDVGGWMVASGQAWSSRWHGRLGPYAAQEAQARTHFKGIWAQPGAELPRDFRQRVGSCYERQANGQLKRKPL